MNPYQICINYSSQVCICINFYEFEVELQNSGSGHEVGLVAPTLYPRAIGVSGDAPKFGQRSVIPSPETAKIPVIAPQFCDLH